MDERSSNRDEFLERYPEVRPEELDALIIESSESAPPATPKSTVGWGRTPIIVVTLLSVVVVASGALALRVNYVIDHRADAIASELADREIERVEKQFETRLDEGRALASSVFSFLVDLVQTNTTMRNLSGRWQATSREVDSLVLDIRAIDDSPIDAGRRLWKTGPSRVEAIVLHASAFMVELESFIPRMLAALRDARKAIDDPDRRVEAVLSALDQLIVPLVEEDEDLSKRWGVLRKDVRGWTSAISSDLEMIRGSLDGDRLSREFVGRITREVFGID